MRTARRMVGLLVLAGLVGGSPLVRAEEDAEGMRRAMEQAKELRQKAEERERAGYEGEAAELRKKAEAIESSVKEWKQGREKSGKEDRDGDLRELKEIIGGLEQGMVALKRLGRGEEVERLGRIADEVRGKIKERREREGGEGKKERGRDDDINRERNAIANQLEICRLAAKACAETRHGDAAERLEQCARALKMDLEGRRDDEANEFRKRAPNADQRRELLQLAAHCLDELGRADQAQMVRQFAGAERKDRPRDDVTERLERLEKMVRDLQRVIEEQRGKGRDRD